ncbi:MAG: hypothetical protein V1799_05395 [bacterium]
MPMNRILSFIGKKNDSFRSKMIGHAAGILFMTILFGVVITFVGTSRTRSVEASTTIDRYLKLQDIDFGDPIDRVLFEETLARFYPGQSARNDSLMNAITELRQRRFGDPRYKTGSDLQGLTPTVIANLAFMVLQFLVVYGIVLVVLYLAAQRIALYRFIKMKQHRASYLAQVYELVMKFSFSSKEIQDKGWRIAVLLVKAAVKGAALVLLFSPAYVIAYSVKTSVDTSSMLFMILLAIISNGVLIHAANRFFTFLVSESRKGYVQTAVVKNLHASYEWNTPDGVPLHVLLETNKNLRSHVLHHIYLNARFQFLPTLKEHAAFLITGLIIIEMALNIQGHLCYELLQQILYRQYDVVALIVLGIFLIIKATEIGVDIWYEKERRRYGF